MWDLSSLIGCQTLVRPLQGGFLTTVPPGKPQLLPLPSDWLELENRLPCLPFKFPVYNLEPLGTQKRFFQWLKEALRHWDLLGSRTITNRWVQTQTSSTRQGNTEASQCAPGNICPFLWAVHSWQQRLLPAYCCIPTPRAELGTVRPSFNIYWINEEFQVYFHLSSLWRH